MKEFLIPIGIVAVLVVALVVMSREEPARETPAQAEASAVAQAQLDKADEIEETVVAQNETQSQRSEKEPTTDEVPDVAQVEFKTSTGTFVVELYKEWAPQGVERFLEIIADDVYEDARFFRVVPGFVVQWGIPADPKVAAKWRNNTIPDDPVNASNAKGTLTFATSGPNSRTTQVFINLADNQRLDDMGFAPIGKVIEGMDVVEGINAEYGQRPDQGAIQTRGNEYLKEAFPNLDYIRRAEIVEKEASE